MDRRPATTRSYAPPCRAARWSGCGRSAERCLRRHDGPGLRRRTGAAACAGSLPAPGRWTAPLHTAAESGARESAARSCRYRDAVRLAHASSEQTLQPWLQAAETVLKGAIELQRSNGDEALHHRMEIRARPAVLGIPGDRNPVTLLAARIDHLGRGRRTGTMTQASQLDATDMFQRQ